MEATRTISASKNIKQKQDHILGGIAKLSTTVQDLGSAAVAMPPHTPFSPRRRRALGAAGSPIVRVQFRKSRYVVVPVALLFPTWFHCLSGSTHF